jgi:AcrR family transcriptional regulator
MSRQVDAAVAGPSAGVGVRRRIARAERRRQIVDAARSVFVEHGYAGARMQHIAKRAEVTEGLLYKHFDSKQALFEGAVLAPLETMITELADLTGRLLAETAPMERRRRFEAMHEIVLRTCVEFVPLLGVALFAEGGREFYRNRLAPMLDRVYSDSDKLMRSWPVHQPLDGRTAFTMTFGMHLGLALDAHMRGEELDVPRLSATLAGVVVRGLSRPINDPNGPDR